jgi:hypothetical protein
MPFTFSSLLPVDGLVFHNPAHDLKPGDRHVFAHAALAWVPLKRKGAPQSAAANGAANPPLNLGGTIATFLNLGGTIATFKSTPTGYTVRHSLTSPVVPPTPAGPSTQVSGSGTGHAKRLMKQLATPAAPARTQGSAFTHDALLQRLDAQPNLLAFAQTVVAQDDVLLPVVDWLCDSHPALREHTIERASRDDNPWTLVRDWLLDHENVQSLIANKASLIAGHARTVLPAHGGAAVPRWQPASEAQKHVPLDLSLEIGEAIKPLLRHTAMHGDWEPNLVVEHLVQHLHQDVSHAVQRGIERELEKDWAALRGLGQRP